jgi:hypothetical protein
MWHDLYLGYSILRLRGGIKIVIWLQKTLLEMGFSSGAIDDALRSTREDDQWLVRVRRMIATRKES